MSVQGLIQPAPVEQSRQRIAHGKMGQFFAQLKVGNGKTDILGNQFQIETRGFDIRHRLGSFLEIKKPDRIALRRQRHAKTGGIVPVEMLAGNVAVTRGCSDADGHAAIPSRH